MSRELELIAKHRRHVELSPGVGEDVQRYALAVLDDLAADLALTASPQAAPEGWGPSHRQPWHEQEDAASPQVQGVEAVAWQYRTPKLLSDGWHPWQQCDKELFDELTEHGSYAGRPVQVRALCVTPQRAPGVDEVDAVGAALFRDWNPSDRNEGGPYEYHRQRIREAIAFIRSTDAAPVSAARVDDCAKCGESNRLNCNDECWNCGAALASGVDAKTEEDEADVIQRRRLAAKHAAAQDQGEGNGP
jgi:hypothetical protein